MVIDSYCPGVALEYCLVTLYARRTATRCARKYYGSTEPSRLLLSVRFPPPWALPTLRSRGANRPPSNPARSDEPIELRTLFDLTRLALPSLQHLWSTQATLAPSGMAAAWLPHSIRAGLECPNGVRAWLPQENSCLRGTLILSPFSGVEVKLPDIFRTAAGCEIIPFS